MDGARFDRIVRFLTSATATSRRSTIFGIVAGLLASQSTATETGLARRRARGQERRGRNLQADGKKGKGKGKKKKKGKTPPAPPIAPSPLPPPVPGGPPSVPPTSPPPLPPPPPPGGCSPACTGGRTCVSGVCTCPGALRDCGDAGCLECCPSENFGYCCPPSRPTCWDDFGNEHFQRCTANGTCQCPDALPAECSKLPTVPEMVCWQCCTGSDCADDPQALAQGRLTCNAGGTCECESGYTFCRVLNPAPDEPGSRCTDTDIDRTNCGFCGNICMFGLEQRCVGGQCVQ